jgi:hypothetical protein
MDNIQATFWLIVVCVVIYAAYTLFAKEEDPTTGKQVDHHDKSFGTGFFVWLGALVLVIVAIEALR